MSITLEQLNLMDKCNYRIVDIRTAIEVDHGKMPDSINVPMLDENSGAKSSDDFGDIAEEIYAKTADKIISAIKRTDSNKTANAEADAAYGDCGDIRLVIVCAKGINSEGVAKHLCEKGFDAVSLEGGYMAWLLDTLESQKGDDLEFAKNVEMSLRKKFRKTIWCRFTKAINEYELVKPGDRIAVCISGGKDSMLMAKLFQELKIHNKFDFSVKFLVMDPGYSLENRKVIEDNARKLNVPINIFESDIFDSVYNVEKSPCYLCARMRRGHLYAYARELGCNKIALGHHYDDVIETILMGMLYGAQMQTMMPKLHSTNFEGMELIRPLYLIREDDIKAWRDYNGLHFIQCACKFTDTCTTCNNEENQSKRIEVKNLIAQMKKTNPFVESNIFRSVENANIDTLVAYKSKGVKHHFLETYDDK